MFSMPHLTRRETLELLDAPGSVTADLSANLADIRRLNRWFGGVSLVRHYIASQVAPSAGVVTLLDVATGSADIPLDTVRWGLRHNIELRATGLDHSLEVLAEARRLIDGEMVELVHGDARALPWPDQSFDLVTCSLALHHFDPAGAVEVLREMGRVARQAVIVIDLRRSYAGYAGTWLVTRIIARNRLTRHDGPLSVLRAYTKPELLRLAESAGVWPARVRRHRFFRLALVCAPEQSHG